MMLNSLIPECQPSHPYLLAANELPTVLVQHTKSRPIPGHFDSVYGWALWICIFMILPRPSWQRAEWVPSFLCRRILTSCVLELKSSLVKANFISK